MAMPPDGASPWRHQDDVWVVSDDDSEFFRLIVRLDNGQPGPARLAMPHVDSEHDAFFVLGVRQGAPGARAVVERYETTGTVEVAWAPEVSGPTLIPEAFSAIRPRRKMRGEVEGSEPIARLRVSPDGAIELIDPRGRLRLAFWISGTEVPRAAVLGKPIEICGGTIHAVLPEHPGTTVGRHESSRP